MSEPSSPENILNMSDLPSLPTISPGLFSDGMNLPSLPQSTQTIIDLTSPPRTAGMKRTYNEVVDLTGIIEEEEMEDDDDDPNFGVQYEGTIGDTITQDDTTVMSTEADDGNGEPLLWDVAGKERWM